MNNWADISTAPKDGQTIKVRVMAGNEYNARWCDTLVERSGQHFGAWLTGGSWGGYIVKPIHWKASA